MPLHLRAGLAGALVALAAGCGTGGFRTIKTRGVYTTGGYSGTPSIDMPKDSYIAVSRFEAGQTPVAMIVGYHDCTVTLEVAVLPDRQAVEAKNIYIGSGKAAAQPLAISKPGDYEVRLIVNGSVHDSYRFSVAPR